MPIPEPALCIEQLNIEVAGQCNLQCTTCPQARVNGGRGKSFLVKMTLGEFQKVLDDAYQYRNHTHPFCISLHGSGEPTLHPKLPEMILYAKSIGDTYVSFSTNGNYLNSIFSRKIIKAGINEVTVSFIGYNKEMCHQLMVGANFDRMVENIRAFKDILQQGHYSNAKINTRHLIVNHERVDWEVEQYRKNIVEPLGVESEIWLQHNWNGALTNMALSREEMAKKKGLTQKSCGRPHANFLEVRAGGIEGHSLAVVSCAMILGHDKVGVLGHLDTETIAEVVAGKLYESLRFHHARRAFDETFCNGCDYLYPDLDVLAWTNKKGRTVGQSQTAKFLNYPDSVNRLRKKDLFLGV